MDFGDDVDVANVTGERYGSYADNHVVVMPIPLTLNCSGTVTAMEFCYFRIVRDSVIQYGTEYQFITLLILVQNSSLTYTIRNRIDIYSTPTPEICTDRQFEGVQDDYRYCCDSMVLNITDRFSLPALNFAFGIISPSELLQLGYLLLHNPEYRVEQYSNDPVSGIPVVNNTFTLTRPRTQQTLRLLKFVISK